METPDILRGLAEALLIGFLVGAQRESSKHAEERQAGLRDFLLISVLGGICALIQNAWLAVAVVLAMGILLAVFRYQAAEREGVTTEIAAVTTFCLGFLTLEPNVAHGGEFAVGLAIAIVVILEAKRAMHRFVRETITEREFEDTLRFLGIIFIIYPILPEGSYGPYGFFSPQKVWLFVIVVSSISFAGYFLQKFFGARIGLRVAGVLGGLASSTAATASLSRRSREEPEISGLCLEGVVLANAVQFPRVLAIAYFVNAALGWSVAPMLGAMAGAGLLAALLAGRINRGAEGSPEMKLGNPFHLTPALRFAAILTLLLFLGKLITRQYGDRGLMWLSAIAGSMDVDAVVLSLSELPADGAGFRETAQAAVFLALLSNAVVKGVIATYAGGAGLGRRLALAFAAIFAAGAAVWIVT